LNSLIAKKRAFTPLASNAEVAANNDPRSRRNPRGKLMQETGIRTIDILKADIEGAEKEGLPPVVGLTACVSSPLSYMIVSKNEVVPP